MENELELLDRCMGRAGLYIDGAYSAMGDDAEIESLCEEIGAEMQGDLSIHNWNAACKAVQARRAAA
jgi:hypothetical protein